MKFLISFALWVVFFVGCQQAPTSVLEESVDVFEARTVLLDTRSPLEYTSFHIKGSTNLLIDDFVILKNPMAKPENQKRTFDPNLPGMIERLAHRGVHPGRKIILIGSKKESIENKKWKWMLNSLDVNEVQLSSIEQMRKNKNRNFAEAEATNPWELRLSPDMQKELILNKTQRCFVEVYPKNKKWNAEYCH